jgi:hypothetical protein
MSPYKKCFLLEYRERVPLKYYDYIELGYLNENRSQMSDNGRG